MKRLITILLLLTSCGSDIDNKFNGYIEGEYVYVAPYASGILDDIYIIKGQNINVGDKLFSVDKDIWQANLIQAQNELDKAHANFADLSKGKRKEELDIIIKQRAQALAALDNAEKEYKRIDILFKADAVSKAEYDTRLADYKSAKAKVAELNASLETAMLSAREDELQMARLDIENARQNLFKTQKQFENTSAISKVTGQVEDVYFRLGEYIPLGTPVISILPPENVKIRFYVSQRQLPMIKLNMPVSILCDGCKTDLDAKVSFISTKNEFTPPVIYSVESREKLVFMIEAVFNDKSKNLHPGQPITVRIKSND